MRTWLLRGGVLAVVHGAAQTIVAAFTVRNPTSQSTLAAIVLGILVGMVAVWGVIDTWRAVPRRETAWLIAALITGWGAGILGVIGRALFVDQTGPSELGSALTGGAAFTALLVFVPAGLGLLAGRWIKPPTRQRKPSPEDEPPAEKPTPTPRPRAQRGGARSTPRS